MNGQWRWGSQNLRANQDWDWTLLIGKVRHDKGGETQGTMGHSRSEKKKKMKKQDFFHLLGLHPVIISSQCEKKRGFKNGND